MHSILDRTDVARGALDEYEAFAALIEPLDAAAWDAPTRCCTTRSLEPHIPR